MDKLQHQETLEQCRHYVREIRGLLADWNPENSKILKEYGEALQKALVPIENLKLKYDAARFITVIKSDPRHASFQDRCQKILQSIDKALGPEPPSLGPSIKRRQVNTPKEPPKAWTPPKSSISQNAPAFPVEDLKVEAFSFREEQRKARKNALNQALHQLESEFNDFFVNVPKDFRESGSHPNALLPEATSSSFQESGLLMIFSDEDLAALEDAHPTDTFVQDEEEEDDDLEIDVQPVEEMDIHERIVRSLIRRLERALRALIEALRGALVLEDYSGYIEAHIYLNRMARVLGLFKLDNHLPMITHIQSILPIEVKRERPNILKGPLEVVLDSQKLRAFDTSKAQEILHAVLALTGWLVEGIPTLDREFYEQELQNLYDDLEWAPSKPSDLAPTREGWAMLSDRQIFANKLESHLDRMLTGLISAVLHKRSEGYENAADQLRKISDLYVIQSMAPIWNQVTHVAEKIGRLKFADATEEPCFEEIIDLVQMLSTWVSELDGEGIRQRILDLQKRYREDPVRKMIFNTSEMARDVLTVLAPFNILINSIRSCLQQKKLELLRAQEQQIDYLIDLAQKHRLKAIIIAVRVIILMIHTPKSKQDQAFWSLIHQAETRLKQLYEFAIDNVSQTDFERSPLYTVDTYFLINDYEQHRSFRCFHDVLSQELKDIFGHLFKTLEKLKDASVPMPMLQNFYHQQIYRLERIVEYTDQSILTQLLNQHRKISEYDLEEQEHSLQLLQKGFEKIYFYKTPLIRLTSGVKRFIHYAKPWLQQIRVWVDRLHSDDESLDRFKKLLTESFEALMPHALNSGELSIVGLMAMLQEILKGPDVHLLDYNLIENFLYWFERVLGKSEAPKDEAIQRDIPAIETQVQFPIPLASFRGIGADRFFKGRALTPIQLVWNIGIEQALDALLKGAQNRATALGKNIVFKAISELQNANLKEMEEREIRRFLAFISASQEILSGLIDHAWPLGVSKGSCQLTLSDVQRDLVLSIQYNGEHLGEKLFQHVLRHSGQMPVSFEEALSQAFQNVQVLQALPEGNHLVMAMAMLKSWNGAISLGASEEVPEILVKLHRFLDQF